MNEYADYIVSNYPNVLTEAESKTVRTIRRLHKAARYESTRARPRECGSIAGQDSDVLEQLADGEDAFWERLVTRVRAGCPEVFWNLCAKCGGLTATPKARQCLHCGHDWH